MQAVIVCGPEASGTKMLTECFCRCGFMGSWDHDQPFDDLNFAKAVPNNLVFRQSFPHGKRIPDLSLINQRLITCGYAVKVAVIIRDKDCCSLSQVRATHSPDRITAKAKIEDALMTIFVQLAKIGVNPHVVLYEPFIKSEKVREQFFRQFNLPVPVMHFFNSNAKYLSSS